METKEQIQSEMYHSFITEMSIMYMSPKVHIYPKVTRSTCLSTTIQDYPSHMYMYPKLYKPHVHVSKTIQATCTCLQKYMYPKLSKPHAHMYRYVHIP